MDQCLNPYLICHYANSETGRILSAGFSPYDTKFRNILDELDRHEKDVEKDIAVLKSAGNLHSSNSDKHGITDRSGDTAARVREWCMVTTCGLHGGSATTTGIACNWNLQMVPSERQIHQVAAICHIHPEIQLLMGSRETRKRQINSRGADRPGHAISTRIRCSIYFMQGW